MSTDSAEERPDFILVVDDDEDIARFVMFNLKLHGFETAHAPDGQIAHRFRTAVKPESDEVLATKCAPRWCVELPVRGKRKVTRCRKSRSECANHFHAARIAIDPDQPNEREFLQNLS